MNVADLEFSASIKIGQAMGRRRVNYLGNDSFEHSRMLIAYKKVFRYHNPVRDIGCDLESRRDKSVVGL